MQIPALLVFCLPSPLNFIASVIGQHATKQNRDVAGFGVGTAGKPPEDDTTVRQAPADRGPPSASPLTASPRGPPTHTGPRGPVSQLLLVDFAFRASHLQRFAAQE